MAALKLQLAQMGCVSDKDHQKIQVWRLQFNVHFMFLRHIKKNTTFEGLDGTFVYVHYFFKASFLAHIQKTVSYSLKNRNNVSEVGCYDFGCETASRDIRN